MTKGPEATQPSVTASQESEACLMLKVIAFLCGGPMPLLYIIRLLLG